MFSFFFLNVSVLAQIKTFFPSHWKNTFTAFLCCCPAWCAKSSNSKAKNVKVTQKRLYWTELCASDAATLSSKFFIFGHYSTLFSHHSTHMFFLQHVWHALIQNRSLSSVWTEKLAAELIESVWPKPYIKWRFFASCYIFPQLFVQVVSNKSISLESHWINWSRGTVGGNIKKVMHFTTRGVWLMLLFA